MHFYHDGDDDDDKFKCILSVFLTSFSQKLNLTMWWFWKDDENDDDDDNDDGQDDDENDGGNVEVGVRELRPVVRIKMED